LNADTINDVSGIDTLQSSLTRSLATFAMIENLTLTGTAAINGTGNAFNNVITGNTSLNILTGGLGVDTLNGGTDAVVDTLNGGLGNDIYVMNNAVADTVIDAGGIDVVLSSVTRTLVGLDTPTLQIEHLTLSGSANINGTGNSLANNLTGNTGLNTLTGDLGNDILNGGTDALVDTLNGGLGNDAYVMNNVVADTVIDAGGIDTVLSTVTRSLAGLDTVSLQIENLTLTGAAAINGTGNALNNTITGNTSLNTLVGADGNDILNGGTDALVDTLDGGLGNDTYVMNNVTVDTIIDGGGIDTLSSSLTRSLLGLDTVSLQIEHLTLTGTAAINGTGNSLANTLTGNAGLNVLSGGDGGDTLNGGTDAIVDTLNGGLGNDIYVMNNATADTLIDAGGIDVVQSSVTRTLAGLDTPTLQIEYLTLTGAAAINGTGNSLANTITGNTAVNTLDGGANNDILTGNGGADILLGGLGADTFRFVALTDSNDVSGIDAITDFNRAALDVINVSLIDANAATVANDAFTTLLAAGTAFTTAGEYRLTTIAGGYRADFNTDTDATAELSITIQTSSVFAAGAGWFVL
jgi:Ca2+-binding RTX toxin-like protein